MRILYILLSLGLFFVIFTRASHAHPLHVQKIDTLHGKVIDTESGEPISFATIHLTELNKTVNSHGDGTFTLRNVPSGTYRLRVHRIGYQTISRSLTIGKNPENTTEFITVALKETVLSSDAVEIVSRSLSSGNAHLEDASTRLSGSNLRDNLAVTLGETLRDLPGFSLRSMGSAPGRPVLRGLGGERLLILENGECAGDLSSQSADHAVTIDPGSAEEIEIARGPEALRFGSNAVGGVINVVNEHIPESPAEHFHGAYFLQGQSASTGLSTGVKTTVPLHQKLTAVVDGNLRSTRNLQTPEGELSNSGIFSTDNTAGLSYHHNRGYTGLTGSIYLNNYGIPPDPLGGHPGGVTIEMEKYGAKLVNEFTFKDSFFKSAKGNFSFTNYYHREIESNGAIGTEFGLLTGTFSVLTHHGKTALSDRGKFGLWGKWRDYAVNGANTPDSESRKVALFLIEEKKWDDFQLKWGARYDYNSTMPEQNDPDSDIGNIRARRFNALSGSVSLNYFWRENLRLGSIVLYSFRAPSQEELYSEGPHLAAYSYEVGNPDLNPERGLSTELFLKWNTDRFAFETNFYRNSFSNYLYPVNTGRQSFRFPSLQVYQFDETRALFHGFEVKSQFEMTSTWAVNGSMSYTHARQRESAGDGWHPLPMIPPLKTNLGVDYAPNPFRVGISMDWVARQNRTGEFETETTGYTLLNLDAQYHFQRGKILHTFSLSVGNLLNTTYRNHLSRIKEITPEAGRNISLHYRGYF